METQATPATLPCVGCYNLRWALLEPEVGHKHKKGSHHGDRDSSNPCSAAGGSCIKTEATCLNSSGDVVRFSFCHEAPPASSRMWCSSSPSHDEGGGGTLLLVSVVAAHGDSVLLQMDCRHGLDYFVYTAGAAADPPRPPSSSLLPIHWVPYGWGERRPKRLDNARTGLLRRRRGDNDLVVSELTVTEGDDVLDAELLVFRSGEWSVTPAEIIHDDCKAEELFRWKTDMVVPVGDRQLCWIDLYRGIILCDLFDHQPLRLRYVSLPVEPPAGEFDDDDIDEYYSYESDSGSGGGHNPRVCLMKDRAVCATDGGDTLKFVDIFPRCCCGGPGVTTCNHSSTAFVINTWTLTMSDMTWTMDAIVDATELWSLHAYAGIPRIRPYYPAVSTHDSHIICLLVSIDDKYCKKETFWKIMLDTRSKTLLSVLAYKNPSRQMSCWLPYSGNNYVPSEISGYLLTSCSGDATKAAAIVVDIPAAAATTTTTTIAVISKESNELSNKSAEVSEIASPEEILAALEEIPDLGCDDLLKAYSVLINDDSGRRFRSLLVLPMGLRKKWLLIEVKNSQSCSICSACTATT